MTEQRKTLFQGLRFDVDQVLATTRDGRSAVREVVTHPGAVVILALDGQNRVVLIRNHRFAVDKTLWELPAGTLEPGEDPADCAARELEEETGYRADRVEPLCSFFTSPGICTERMYAFVATGLTHVGQQLEETELIEPELVPLDQVRKMIAENVIEDAKTIASMGYWMLFAEEQGL